MIIAPGREIKSLLPGAFVSMPSLVTIDAAVPCLHRRSRSFVLLNEAVRRSEGSGTPHRLSAKGFRHQILRFAPLDREGVLYQILRFAE